MRIGIDATSVYGIKEGAQSGLTTYTVHIVKNLITMDNDNKYYIYCRNEVPHQLNTVSSSVAFRVFKKTNRKLLQQIRLPIAALFDRLDLLFFPYNSASIFCPCKGIVTIHDLHPFVVPERFAKIHSVQIHGSTVRSMINKVYWKKILKIAAKRTDRIIAVSHATKKDIENIFHIPSEKIDVVYEGVDKEYFNPDSDGKDLALFREKYNLSERYILCVGTHAYKNIGGAVKAFDIVKKKISDPLKLVIAGNKRPIDEEIFQKVKELNLESQIIFTDFFPDEDLKYLYQCAELFLFPSFYEGFGLPVLEAFACGTPVVTSTAGSLPEVAGEAGLLVDPNDSEEIATSVLALLSDKEFREKKRQQGLKQVEKFSWEKAARKMLEVFDEVLLEKGKIFFCHNCNCSRYVYSNPHIFIYKCPVCGLEFRNIRNHYIFKKIRKQKAILFSQITCAIKQIKLKRSCISIGYKVRVAPGFKCLSGNLIVGDHVQLSDVYIDSTSLVTIGNFTFFGPGVKLLTATHDITKFDIERQQTIRSKPISIGKGVFIASGVIVIGGTCIGDHAVIGAGSVVTNDIPDYSFVAGNPARVIKRLERPKD